MRILGAVAAVLQNGKMMLTKKAPAPLDKPLPSAFSAATDAPSPSAPTQQQLEATECEESRLLSCSNLKEEMAPLACPMDDTRWDASDASVSAWQNRAPVDDKLLTSFLQFAPAISVGNVGFGFGPSSANGTPWSSSLQSPAYPCSSQLVSPLYPPHRPSSASPSASTGPLHAAFSSRPDLAHAAMLVTGGDDDGTPLSAAEMASFLPGDLWGSEQDNQQGLTLCNNILGSMVGGAGSPLPRLLQAPEAEEEAFLRSLGWTAAEETPLEGGEIIDEGLTAAEIASFHLRQQG